MDHLREKQCTKQHSLITRTVQIDFLSMDIHLLPNFSLQGIGNIFTKTILTWTGMGAREVNIQRTSEICSTWDSPARKTMNQSYLYKSTSLFLIKLSEPLIFLKVWKGPSPATSNKTGDSYPHNLNWTKGSVFMI